MKPQLMPPCYNLTELFVQTPPGGQPAKRKMYRDRVEQAKEICTTCPHLARCLEMELARMREGVKSVGVFGGTTEGERKVMLGVGLNGRIVAFVHGTTSGYRRHIDENTVACAACRLAHTSRVQERKRQQRERAQ